MCFQQTQTVALRATHKPHRDYRGRKARPHVPSAVDPHCWPRLSGQWVNPAPRTFKNPYSRNRLIRFTYGALPDRCCILTLRTLAYRETVMNEDPNDKAVADLKREVAELRRYRDIVRGQGFVAKKLTEVAGVVWLGPSLTLAIHNLIKARRTDRSIPEMEVAEVVAAIVRRVLRVGLIAVIVAIVPAAIAIWQIDLMRDQLSETRQQTTELVRYQRATEIGDVLMNIESQLFGERYESTGLNFDETVRSEGFYARCMLSGTQEYAFVDNVHSMLVPYVAFLSEQYLLATRVLNPLDRTQSEEWISANGDSSPADVYWSSYKMREVIRVIETCRSVERFGNSGNPFLQLMLWSIQDTSLDYSMVATDVKFRYAAAEGLLDFTADVEVNQFPTVKVVVENQGPRAFDFVNIRCLVSADGFDLDSVIKGIQELLPDSKEELSIEFRNLIVDDYEDVRVDCRVHNLLYEGGLVDNADFVRRSLE